MAKGKNKGRTNQKGRNQVQQEQREVEFDASAPTLAIASFSNTFLQYFVG